MLKAYEEYQKSELPWVNEIPSHWMWLRNGFLLVNHKERVGDRFSDFQLLSLTTKGIKEKNIEDASGKVPDSYEGCFLYTSDAADDLLCVDIGGRRII